MRKGRALESAKNSVVTASSLLRFKERATGKGYYRMQGDCYVIVVGLNVMKWHRAIPNFLAFLYCCQLRPQDAQLV